MRTIPGLCLTRTSTAGPGTYSSWTRSTLDSSYAATYSGKLGVPGDSLLSCWNDMLAQSFHFVLVLPDHI